MNAHNRAVMANVVNVTPELACEWLAKNTRNRQIRRGHVKFLADQMKAGKWRLTHQGVAFGADGAVLDGQHRLEAVVASGVSVPLMVFFSWDADVFGVLDKGINRTVRDDLKSDSRLVEPATYLAKTMHRVTGRVSSTAVRDILTALGDDLSAIRTAGPSVTRGRTTAPMVAAVALRYRQAGAEGREYVTDQWRAWVNLDVPAMSPAIAALLRRADNIVNRGGGTAAHERAALGWIAFNPEARSLTKILVRDLNSIIDEVREAVARALTEAQQEI